jgi:hypothetical protein
MEEIFSLEDKDNIIYSLNLILKLHCFNWLNLFVI